MKQAVTSALAAMTLMAGLATAGERYAVPGVASPCRGRSTVEAACSAAQQAGWRFPLPAGTRVIELPAVPIADRVGKFVRMQLDLVVGGDTSDPNALFYRPNDVAVDSSGRMYISDTGNHRVQVFDQDGSFVRSLGRRGQGPGEFEIPRSVSIVGSQVFVWALRKHRFLTWELDGSLGPELRMSSVNAVDEVSPLDDGTLVLLHRRPIRPGGVGIEVSRRLEYLVQTFGLDREPGRVFLQMESDFPRTRWSPYPAHAVDPSGVVYVSTADEYQVVAIDAVSGVAKWALRVDTPRRSTREEVARGVEAAKEANPDRADWIERYTAGRIIRDLADAVTDLWVDGHGHLYVVLAATLDDRQAVQADAVIDVYSRDGERLFAGLLDGLGYGWRASLGDYVYNRWTNLETEERALARFVLQEPFE